MQTKKIIWRSK